MHGLVSTIGTGLIKRPIAAIQLLYETVFILPAAARTGDKLTPSNDPSAALAFPGLAVRWFLFGQDCDEDFVERADKFADLGERYTEVRCEESVVPNLSKRVR